MAGALDERLRSLARPGSLTRLDLSQLEFIDSSGIRILMRAIERASRDGGNLEVAPETTPAVRRTIELTGIAEHLWPSGGAEPDVPDAQEERGHG